MNASPARKQLVKSLSAVLAYVGEGGLADTTLPTAPAAEAVRLLRNGMSVALFASVEMFVRDRIGELLSELASDENRPDFKNLPNAFQLAATIGVVDAIRFRFGQRQDEFEISEIIRAAQAHAANIASTSGRQYVFSALTFGQGSSNINEGVLRGFFQAVQSNQLYDAMGPVLTEMHFDFRAVDLANENGSFSFKKFARWRHTAAHDALATVDSSILLSRIRACMMVAFAFDCLASTAVDHFMSHFPAFPVLTTVSVDLR